MKPYQEFKNDTHSLSPTWLQLGQKNVYLFGNLDGPHQKVGFQERYALLPRTTHTHTHQSYCLPIVDTPHYNMRVHICSGFVGLSME